MKWKKNTSDILAEISKYHGDQPDLLRELVYAIRPTKSEIKQKITPSIAQLIVLLKAHEGYRNGLKRYLSALFQNKKLLYSIIDTGAIGNDSFTSEIRKRLSYKLLPYQPDKQTIDYLLVNVFYKKEDVEWVEILEENDCKTLMEILDFKDICELEINDHLIDELLFSVRILAQRVTGLAFDKDILRMTPEYLNFDSPFVGLMDATDEYLDDVRSGICSRSDQEEHYKHLKVLLHQCRIFIDNAYKNRSEFGISLNTNQQLINLSKLLDRMEEVISWISCHKNGGTSLVSLQMLKALLKFNIGKNEIRSYINQSTQIIAQEITQHTGEKGEHYITTTASEYKKMLKTALGGGLIVGFLCFIKLWFSTLDTSLFGHAFLYSMNYALGFILIYLTGMTLATKQPAMTAATIAKTLKDGENNENKYENIAELMVRLSRSQFIAFVGNVFMAFPIALLLIAGLMELSGYNMATKKAHHLLHDLHPIDSPALSHAAIAGIFLFFSGLIAGKVDNATIYNNITQRIAEHPALKFLIGEKARNKLANFYNKNAGGIISNFWFGVFMGCTGIIGAILGLNIDIRHITFASGNLALGIFGENFQTEISVILWSVVGIGLIGFVNFIVSFTLSLMLALRSRGISITELRQINAVVSKKFFSNPLPFFFPPRER